MIMKNKKMILIYLAQNPKYFLIIKFQFVIYKGCAYSFQKNTGDLLYEKN